MNLKFTNFITLVLFGAVILSSCEKEEKQRACLDGKWIYEKATWQEKAFKRTDILDDYRYIDVFFTKDGDVKFIDVKDNIVFIGKYSLDERTDFTYVDDEGNTMTTQRSQMMVSYTDTTTKELYQELWDVVRISQNVFKYEAEINGKPAYFKLRRQIL